MLARTFAPWTCCDTTGRPGYPYMKIRGSVALIGLCSGVPRAPFVASGRLGHEQREALAALLVQAGERGLTRVVMIHHPPRISDPGGHIGRGLADHQAFAAVIRAVGAELILHGHNHKLYVDHMDGPRQRVPVVGVPSASGVKGKPRNRAGYHLFSFEGSGQATVITARARGLMPGETMIGDLGPLPL